VAENAKFYLDEHVDRALMKALRRHGYDVLSSTEAQLDGEADVLVLQYAASRGRVLVTQDADFLRMHSEGVRHAGIVYFPQHTSLRRMVEGVLLVAGAMSAQEVENSVQYL